MVAGAAELHVVTGAFGYTGKYIARRLLAAGKKVRTLTGHPASPDPFGGAVEVAPLDFRNPAGLVSALRGASVLYNTYWVRFAQGDVTFEKAVANSKTLITAAEQAGIGRIVHISITSASPDSLFPYFRGKAAVEEAIRQSSLSYAILRPTVIFGLEDILINNIAWLLRKVPLFTIAGNGDYRLQPVFVEDVAALAVTAAEQKESATLDVAGPETYTFDALVRLIREKVGSTARILQVSPTLQLLAARVLSLVVRDVLLTRDELGGLMADLLVSSQPPTCPTRFSDWLGRNAITLGRTYASELRRHYARAN